MVMHLADTASSIMTELISSQVSDSTVWALDCWAVLKHLLTFSPEPCSPRHGLLIWKLTVSVAIMSGQTLFSFMNENYFHKCREQAHVRYSGSRVSSSKGGVGQSPSLLCWRPRAGLSGGAWGWALFRSTFRMWMSCHPLYSSHMLVPLFSSNFYYLFLLLNFGAMLWGLWDLSLGTRDWTCTLGSESLNP